ncbi:hypothetical protein B296_00019936 [Ensete ventricosum]|uniref:Uncharacterized protein n=1 Tax=Ensete ventricosum TaxID=4639 RepID=A0A426ZHK5_ENSVE|nr:hypothetical protein B296_00019936 [Ensete ventricosum]
MELQKGKLTRTPSSLLRSPTVRSSIHSLSSIADDEEEEKPHRPHRHQPRHRHHLLHLLLFPLPFALIFFLFLYLRDDSPLFANVLLLSSLVTAASLAARRSALFRGGATAAVRRASSVDWFIGGAERKERRAVRWRPRCGPPGLIRRLVHRRRREEGKEGRGADRPGGGRVLQQWGLLRGRVPQGAVQRQRRLLLLRQGALRGRLDRREVRRVRDRELGKGEPVPGAVPAGPPSWVRGVQVLQRRQLLRRVVQRAEPRGWDADVLRREQLLWGVQVRHQARPRNGDKYAGEYFGDKIHGFGVYHFANGHCYEGSWHEGKKQGFGMYTFRNGDTRCGDWDSGVLKSPLLAPDPAVQRAIQLQPLGSWGQLGLKAIETYKKAFFEGWGVVLDETPLIAKLVDVVLILAQSFRCVVAACTTGGIDGCRLLDLVNDRSQMRRRREPGGCGGEEIGLSSLPIDGVTVLGDVAQQIADAEQRTSHSPIHVDLFVLAGVAAVTPF